MSDLEILMLILETSVKKNGEKPLTNKWLLNIVKLAIKESTKQEREDLIGEFNPDWD